MSITTIVVQGVRRMDPLEYAELKQALTRICVIQWVMTGLIGGVGYLVVTNPTSSEWLKLTSMTVFSAVFGIAIFCTAATWLFLRRVRHY